MVAKEWVLKNKNDMNQAMRLNIEMPYSMESRRNNWFFVKKLNFPWLVGNLTTF